jgi:aspartyl-tRNA(Asn)/glutamyl-tRNA(Gln) amidotransferase subunit A
MRQNDWPTVSEIAKLVSTGKKTALSFTEQALSTIEKEDKTYNAMIVVFSNEARQAAKTIDDKIANGDKLEGALLGVPFVVKDNLSVVDTKTTAASKILNNYHSPITTTAIQEIIDAGGVLVGKTNLDAFGHGSSTENTIFGRTKNACDITKVAGGSSGGSAVAVARGFVPFALGTDTGGSIRQPASFNGVVGLKPSYGAVSRYGAVAMASSTDTIGVIANSVADISTVIDVMAGIDERDMTTINLLPLSGKSLKKIGRIKQLSESQNDKEVAMAMITTEDKLKSSGYEIIDIDIPEIIHALAAYYIIVPAEISSNMARFDGVKYGYRVDNPSNLADMYERTRSESLGRENIRRILTGSYVLSSGYYDAYYLKAQKVRKILLDAMEEIFSKIDVLMTPTSPTTAFLPGNNEHDPVQMYWADVMTVPFSLTGNPAINIPAMVEEEQMPIGLQLVGKSRDDLTLLAMAQEISEVIK